MPQNLPRANGHFAAVSRWPAVELHRWFGRGAIACLAALAMLLVARRAAGALVQPLAWAALLTAIVSVVALRAMAHRHAMANHWYFWGHAFITALGLLVLTSLWLPDSAIPQMLVLAAALVSEEVLCWRQVIGISRAGVNVDVSQASPQPHGMAFVPDEPCGEFASTVMQHIQRCRQVDGSEIVSGTLRAQFTADQRTADVHLAFCPPLAAIPQVEAEAVDGPAARVKVAQVLPNGLRLEVRLDNPASEPTSVVVQMLATTAASSESLTGSPISG